MLATASPSIRYIRDSINAWRATLFAVLQFRRFRWQRDYQRGYLPIRVFHDAVRSGAPFWDGNSGIPSKLKIRHSDSSFVLKFSLESVCGEGRMSIYYKQFRSLLIVIIVCLIYVSCGGGSSSPAPQSAAADPPTNTSPTTSPNNPFLLILPGDSTPGNPIITDARTIAVAGVGASATVQLFLDGSLMGTLTAPNQYGAFNAPLYLFQETYPPGTHSVKAIATYSDGTSAQATGTFVAGPLLTLNSPGDNAIVSGTLAVQGTFSPGATTTLTATLGSLPSLRTQTSPFSLTFDLSGLAAGTYTLTVKATSSTPTATTVIQRTVMVLVNPAFTYTRIPTFAVSANLLAAENKLVVYQSPDGSVRVQDTTASTEVLLSDAAFLQSANYWTINNGRVFASAIGSDSPIGSNNQPQYQIYEWDPDGSRHNLSQLAGASFDFQSDPVAHWPWVIWGDANAVANSPTSYTLLNLETSIFQSIAPPPGSNSVITNDYDFIVSGNTIDFYFAADTTPSGSSNRTSDIFHWNSDSQQYVKITNGGTLNHSPQTDGTLLAWSSNPPPVFGSSDSSAITLASIAAPATQTVVSPNADGFQLRDGLLAWIEGNESTLPGQPSGPFTVKVFDGQSVSTLATSANAYLRTNGGGAIVYETDTAEGQSTTFLWTPTRSSQLLLSGQAHTCILTGQFLYFTIDWSQPLYRVTWR